MSMKKFKIARVIQAPMLVWLRFVSASDIIFWTYTLLDLLELDPPSTPHIWHHFEHNIKYHFEHYFEHYFENGLEDGPQNTSVSSP